MQKNIINKIQKTMESLHFPCEWRIEWFKQKHTIEIVVMIPVTLEKDSTVTDQYEKVNIHDNFVFEDAVLLYDTRLSDIKNSNYLATIEFDKEDGLYGGTIESICKNLRVSVGQAMNDLHEFLQDDAQVRFEIKWNDNNYQNTIKTLKDIDRFDYAIYSYPSEITEDVVDENEVE
ncbi:DUF3013 family protein [Jeotgalibaca ciconiae]|uniref:DUF3013 family protein n=1 Tax=Jeotgalibaca ciconiae TaxID=2496265 RepID=A0A3Q9BLV7_9LACT|nr:DUF3013 family protein [Jeotgalibaca ciconiae]AZP05469.1 DUF3013 family protein [Jeotgalibaca ciconiae]HJB24177.1 DUF3013 family protein [Candidatus Jeotgalibaca pullicola]